jgi:hypothetical protein
MAEKAKPAEAPKPDEKPKPKILFPPIAEGVEDGLKWQDVEVLGTVYRVRELTTQEEDDAFDAAELPDDKINARLQRRMLLSFSIVSPKVAVEDIQAWPGLKRRCLELVMDRMNSLPPADAEGNA